MRRLLATLLLTTAASAHAADGRIDVYGTRISDDTASLTMEQRLLLGGGTTASATFDAGADTELGARLMLSGTEKPLTGGVDVSYFSTDGAHLDLNVAQLALVGGLRMPRPLLARHGRGLHPYVLAGIAGLVIDGDAELGGLHTDIAKTASLYGGGDPVVTPMLAIGFDWQLSPRIGIVAEYRQREFDFDGMSTNSWILPTENIFASGSLNASGLALGISWLLGAAPPPPGLTPP